MIGDPNAENVAPVMPGAVSPLIAGRVAVPLVTSTMPVVLSVKVAPKTRSRVPAAKSRVWPPTKVCGDK